MQIKIGEVTFNTKLVPKNFGSRIFFKISGRSYYQCKKGKFLNPWNYFFKVYSVNTEYRF